MPKLVRLGLMLLGVTVLSLVGVFSGKWGPCGPSNIFALICLMGGGICALLGGLFLAVGFLQFLLQRFRERAAA